MGGSGPGWGWVRWIDWCCMGPRTGTCVEVCRHSTHPLTVLQGVQPDCVPGAGRQLVQSVAQLCGIQLDPLRRK
ncbi:hypothetical protein chiPu_0030886, partial [Chiloscyllium punctatum]|nr:hypothetical protein [Chiloscyllium punctatum]